VDQERSDVNEEVVSENTKGVEQPNGEVSEGENTQRIKRDIERTRDELGETIDEIQERLSFANLSDQVSEHVNNAVDTAKSAIYDATIGKAVNIMKDMTNGNSSVLKTVKGNPLPFVLIGAGAGLLALRAYNGGTTSGRSTRDSSRSESSEGNGSTPSSTLSKMSGAVSDRVSTAYEKVGNVGSSAMETYDRQVRDNPLAVGAVAMAVGAAVGLAVPSTRYEGELMGEARQQFMEKAQNVASDLVDQVKGDS